MACRLTSFTLALSLTAGLLQQTGSVREAEFDVAITNVDVFDSRSMDVLRDRTILVEGDRIAAVVDGAENVSARRVVDGRGRLAAPGFVDTHAHLLLLFGDGGFGPARLGPGDRELLSRVYLDHGVTTLVDMGQPEPWMETMLAWEDDPIPESPNVLLVGGSLISDLAWDQNPPSHHSKLVSSEAAREKVAAYADLGARWLKLYWKLERPEMEAVIDAGRERGLGFYGHIDNGIMTIQQTLELGVKHYEHFFTLTTSTMRVNDEWEEIAGRYGLTRSQTSDDWAAHLSVYFDYIASRPELAAKLEALLDEMAERGASLSTTLNMLAAAVGRSETFSGFEPFPIRSAPQLTLDDAQRETVRNAFDTVLRTLRAAHQKGVTIRIGTDARNGGEALLAELVLLAEAGFSTSEILQIATFNGAQAFGLENEIGVIAAGAMADLVLFDASPLEDIRNALGAKTVFKSGRLVEPRPSLVEGLRLEIDADEALQADRWARTALAAGRYAPPHPVEIAAEVLALMRAGRVDAARQIHALAAHALEPGDPDFRFLRESDLNQVGYELLGEQRVDPAVGVFAFIVERFPDSPNAHDSLGEGCRAAGDRARALKHYRRSVELEPRNVRGAEIVRELEEELAEEASTD